MLVLLLIGFVTLGKSPSLSDAVFFGGGGVVGEVVKFIYLF